MAAPLTPSTINQTSLAAIVGAAVKNVQFVPSANVLPRKILLIGTYDPSLNPGIAKNTPVLVTSPEEVAAAYGRGFLLHRMAIASFAGSQGVETWVAPQDEEGAAVAATGDFTIGGIDADESGTLHMYIAGDYVPVTIAKGDTAAEIATAAAAAINANLDLPVTAAVNGGVPEQVDVTAKSKGLYGNFISMEVNLGFQQKLPFPITFSRTNLSGGSGVPDVTSVLGQLGQGDLQNADFFTDVNHGYPGDTTTWDLLSAYNGEGNDFTGNYSKTVSRPFRVLDGSTENSLNTLVTLGDSRKQDRTNGLLTIPQSPSHPTEFACLAMGIEAATNNNRAEESYIGKILPGVWPGGLSEWNSQYSGRDTALKAGISPTLVEGGAVVLQNVATFYHPDNVPVDSNGYRSQRNISIIQNLLFNVKLNFSQEKWQSITIVDDVTKVSNTVDREKAKDVDAVIDDLVALATAFEGNAWIFSAGFTVSKLQEGGLVVIRPGGTGFNTTLPVVLSGEGGIFDNIIQFDTSLAVFF